jgi:hypothetical protein
LLEVCRDVACSAVLPRQPRIIVACALAGQSGTLPSHGRVPSAQMAWHVASKVERHDAVQVLSTA